MRRQFRELVQCLTHRQPAPRPASRRRRSGETGRAFRLAARKIIRGAVRLPAEAYVVPPFLFGTMDWLNPWYNEMANMIALDEDLRCAEPNHLFPQL